ncbi:MAG: putative membrane protein YfcA [Gammaproteobacteria bacterium]|jgi:uncharacterized membrane protein YfcA
MLSYPVTGAVGVVVYARHGSIPWKMVYWLCLGAIPAPYLGSISLASIPADMVMLLIVILMILAESDTLLKLHRKTVARTETQPPSAVWLVVIGVITGFGSAITGTGGPLIVVSIILYLGLPVLTAVGVIQAIQIPIATFASIGNWEAGNLNLNLSFIIAASMIMGSIIGAIAIHRLPREPVRKYVAWLLVVVGIGIGFRLIYQIALK